MIWIQDESHPKARPPPTPSFKCEETGCLPPVFQEGFISGKQHRTSSCFWGGQGCKGWNNSKQTENYCDGPTTTLCKVNNQVRLRFEQNLLNQG